MSATDDNTFKKLGTEETLHSSGAQRDTRIGKGAFHWMPWTALFLVSRIYENGNRMRGVRNWEKGMPLEQYLDSAIRHLTKYLAGDRSEPHLPQAVWNILNAMQTGIWVKMGLRPKELNDLPDHFTGKEPGTIDPLSQPEIDWLPAWGIDLTKVQRQQPSEPAIEPATDELDELIPKPMIVDEEKIANDPLVKHLRKLVAEDDEL